MKPAVAIIAALPREVRELVRGWKSERVGNLVVYSNGRDVVACAGMGGEQAARAVQAARAFQVTELISVGLVGACDPALRVGDVVRAGVVIDRKARERFVDLRFDGILVTVDRIANVEEKRELRTVYDAGAVDMEAATVCRLAKAHGLGFRAVKAVSDEADFEMGELAQFVTEDGQFRERAFALHAAMRPAMWGKVRALARNKNKAIHALTEALRHELDLD